MIVATLAAAIALSGPLPPGQCWKACEISPRGIGFIKDHEGYRPWPYPDAVGLSTVAYGHLIRPGEKFTYPIVGQAAEDLLRADLFKHQNAVNAVVDVPIWQSQDDALCSFSFNVGAGAMRGSTLVHKLNIGDVAGAADQFLRWTMAGGRVVKGLATRRHDERALFVEDLP